jgi:hypothetical protein
MMANEWYKCQHTVYKLSEHILGSHKFEISRHFPSASSRIVFTEVWRSFLVRAYELFHEFLLGELDNCTETWVMLDKSIFLEKPHNIIAGLEPALQAITEQ